MTTILEKTTRIESPVVVNRGWRVLRVLIGILILAAATAKGHQLGTQPSLGDGLLHARWFNILVVNFELFFGIWLLAGLTSKLTWLASVGCFTVFALVSAYKGIMGNQSCGCFGAATISPWITLTFDLIMIVLLVLFKPKVVITQWKVFLRVFFESCQAQKLKIMSVLGISLVTMFAMGAWFELLPSSSHEHGVSLQKRVLDLGEVKTNIATCEFVLINKTDSPRQLFGVKTDCGCVLADKMPKVIQQKSSCIVSIKILNRDSMPHDFSHKICFFIEHQQQGLHEKKVGSIIGEVKGRFTTPNYQLILTPPPSFLNR